MLFKYAAYGLNNVMFALGLANHTYEFRFVHPDGKALETVTRLVEEEKVRAVIDTVYDMQDAAKAHQKVEGGHVRGKVVIKIN